MATTSSPVAAPARYRGIHCRQTVARVCVAGTVNARGQSLAALWRDSNYEIKPLLRAMLLSDDFWSPANRASLVKSPVDLVIGSLRQFRFSVEDPAPFAIILRQFGQDLFGPPNVKGGPVARLGSIPPRCLPARASSTGCSARTRCSSQRWRLLTTWPASRTWSPSRPQP